MKFPVLTEFREAYKANIYSPMQVRFAHAYHASERLLVNFT